MPNDVHYERDNKLRSFLIYTHTSVQNPYHRFLPSTYSPTFGREIKEDGEDRRIRKFVPQDVYVMNEG